MQVTHPVILINTACGGGMASSECNVFQNAKQRCRSCWTAEMTVVDLCSVDWNVRLPCLKVDADIYMDTMQGLWHMYSLHVLGNSLLH